MTPQERHLTIALRVFAAYSFAFVLLYWGMGAFGSSSFPFTTNSAAKDGLFGMVGLIGAGDVRRHTWAVPTIIVGHLLLIASLVLMLVIGHAGVLDGTLDAPLMRNAHGVAFGWLASDIVIVVLLNALRTSALRSRYGLKYLSAGEFLTLAAISEVLISQPMSVPPIEVAQNTDAYLADFHAAGKWRMRLALFALSFIPLLGFRPPFSSMDAESREAFLRKHFLAERGLFRDVRQSLVRAASQMAYLGYYRDSRSYAECGYRPFSTRAPEPPVRRTGHLQCLLPGNVDDGLTADVVVIGTGAGGATVAHGLAAKGREILMIERGPHVDPSQFSEDEATQFAQLYEDGALTLTRDFRFQVLQGMCVGGSTTVNNAVSFDIPDSVLKRWNGDGHQAGLDEARLKASFARLREWLPIVRQTDTSVANPGFQPFEDGVRALGMDRPPYEWGPVDANITDCLGCGNCNSGCAHGRKLSALDRTLPDAQRRYGTEAFRILAEAQVLKILHSGRHATGVRVRLSDGRTIDVRANTVVVAAGALASSVILKRSGIGGERVGRRLGFNLGCTIVGDMDQPIRSAEGLQMSHALRLPGDGVALEAWFLPLLGFSLFMPGWFAQHQRNMRRYDHMATIGVVVGSESTATVAPARFNRRAVDLEYEPTARDFKLLLGGVKLAASVLLEGGARRVMPPSFTYHEINHRDDIEGVFAQLRNDANVSINSAHPQGGNVISPSPETGVVDAEMRVHGWDNLYVTDASVFPTTVTVNPQLTVMALADYAVAGIT